MSFLTDFLGGLGGGCLPRRGGACAVVGARDEAGHDVVAQSEVFPRVEDHDVIQHCQRSGRILITEDKDFGQLVYAASTRSAGVILLRFSIGGRADMVRSIIELVSRHGDKLAGAHVVMQPGRTRVTGLP